MSDKEIFSEHLVAGLFARWRSEPGNRDQLAADIVQACQGLIDWQSAKLATTTSLEFDDVRQEFRLKIYKILKHYQADRGSTYSFLLNAIQNLGRTLLAAHGRKCGHVFGCDVAELHDVADRHSFDTWISNL